MGWVSSPPNFSACTETVCDMANADLKDVETLQLARNTPHRFDAILKSRPVDTVVHPVDTVVKTDLAPSISENKVVPESQIDILRSKITVVEGTELVLSEPIESTIILID